MSSQVTSNKFTFLDTRQHSKDSYELLADFTYYDDVFGPITARKGFITDYASIDVLYNCMLFLFYVLLVKYGDKSATIHDWLYRGNGIMREDGTIYYPTRKECDEIMARALKAEGVNKFRRYLFYSGVRLGGSSSYKQVNAS